MTTYANLNKTKFGWQIRFHDYIICNQEEMGQIATYIEKNPASREKDKSNSEIVVNATDNRGYHKLFASIKVSAWLKSKVL